jgi:hypothetical protein
MFVLNHNPSFHNKRKERCEAAFPADVEAAVSAEICGGAVAGSGNVGTDPYYYCLP